MATGTTTINYRGTAKEFKPFYQLLAVETEDKNAILQELSNFTSYAVDGLRVGLVCPKGRAILLTDETHTKTRVDFVSKIGGTWKREKFFVATWELAPIGDMIRQATGQKIEMGDMYSGKA